MEKTLITICTVNYNSSEFIDVMLYAFSKLTFHSYKVIIRDNNSTRKDFKKLEYIIKKYKNVTLYKVKTLSTGSVAHGEALNDLVSKIDTEYGVIIDADATFLIKDWDKILINKMNNILPIYGTQADIGSGKFEDFPLMFAMIFKTDILKDLQIDFRPRDLSKFEDTGWELREKFLKGGFNGGLLYDFNTRLYKKGPFANIVCSEYYLSPDGTNDQIFACHFGRGSAPKSKNLVKVDAGSNIFLRIINKALSVFNVLKWKKDKKVWLTICKKIINEQS